MSDLDLIVEAFTVLSWIIYMALVVIGLPGMYASVSNFIQDDDIGLALFAFLLPLFFCLGWGLVVYYLPLLSGAVMVYYVANTLKGGD